MFIITAKLTKKKLIGSIVVTGAILIGIILLLAKVGQGGAEATGAVKNIKTNDDRVAYLNGLGWEVAAEPVETQEVVIPETWDKVMEDYNGLQQSQGMNLEKYKGKSVTRYLYQITNYPDYDENVYACLLVYKNSIIGGDVQSHALDGFMHGLTSN